MFARVVLALANSGQNNDPDGFYQRFSEHWWRLGITLGVAALTYFIVGAIFKSWVWSLVTVVGAAWITWYTVNAWTGDKTSLVTGDSSPGDLFSAPANGQSGFWAFLISFVAAVGLGVRVYRKADRFNAAAGLLTAFSVWLGGMLLYLWVALPILNTHH